MQDFRMLEVWQFAHNLTLSVYQFTKSFPPEERFGLIDQMRRASVSIESNLAEGTGRGGDADFARFVQMAFGSACELECQLIVACDLKYLDEPAASKVLADLERTKRMLSGLLRKLKADGR